MPLSATNASSGDAGQPPEIPDFDIIRPIGQGGFGRVWLATNRTTGVVRAVKMITLRESAATDPAGREITSIVRLEANVRTRHPNLLDIYHVGKTADHLFLVMDPADDASGDPASTATSYEPATLRQRLEDGPLPSTDALRCARQLLSGLAFLHEAGMVHRDVKPANCLFVAGTLKLADFGLLTDAGPQVSRVGTQAYMPPDGCMDERADVYAAGLVVYEMITGMPPESFPRLGAPGTRFAKDPALCVLNRTALRACHPDPRQRFRSAREMHAALQVADSRDGTPPAGFQPWIVGAAMLALAIAAAILWFGRRPTAGVAPGVDVNFITVPYEATIYVDGRQLMDSNQVPYRTPCTVSDLPPHVHDIVLKHDRYADLHCGPVDFAATQEIVARWNSGP